MPLKSIDIQTQYSFSLLETREKYVQVLSPYIGKPDIFQHNSSGKSAAIFVNYWLLFQAYQ
jgi:hypothetical protein